MNILFLSINVPKEDKRDQVTYNFICKEMKWLAVRGHGVYYLSSLNNDREQDGIFFISKSTILECSTFFRRIKNLFFAIRNVFFLFPLFKVNIKATLHLCGSERACIKTIRKFNIDLIHTHFFEPSGESAVLSSRVCGVPLIATLRGAEIQKMPEFNYGACLNKFYEIALRNSISSIDLFTAPNKYLCRKLHKEYGVPDHKIRYLPNGIELISFREEVKKVRGHLLFISIGNMIKLKNFDIIFKSIPLLIREFKFKIFIVGSGPLREKYEKLINELSLGNIVMIKDEMPKDKLYKIVRQCDILIHPSFSEGMPNVVLESLSMGVPCVVSDIPAHQELIHDGFNGYLFDPYSKEDFVRKMKRISLDNDLLTQMKSHCIESVKNYTIERKIDGYSKIYQNLCSRP